MAASRVDVQYFSAADRPSSLASFKRRLVKHQLSSRVSCASSLALRISSTVLRLQEPLDFACRPFLRVGGDDAAQTCDYSGDTTKATEFHQCSSVEVTERSATSSGGSTTGDGEENEDRSNGATHELSGPNGARASHLTPATTPQIEERERIRRQRISLANKGKTPWNKGKSHSPETIARMSERNKIVMQDPKIREKLRMHSHPQSQETREKIRRYMKARMVYERKQLTIIQDWKDSTAMLAKRGLMGDNELQWDSYQTLKKELHRQFYAAKRKRKKVEGPKVLQFEHRLRISEAVRAKWNDPNYRRKVIERIQETRHKGPRTFRESPADTEFDRLLDSLASVPIEPPTPSIFKVGSYTDPQADEKLRKVRMLRERNMVRKESDLETKDAGYHFGDQVEDKEKQTADVVVQDMVLDCAPVADLSALQQAQREATERARFLLSEAEQAAFLAAQALDAAGAHDETLNDLLLEAWTLLDEANKSILNLEVTSLSRN